MDYGQNTPSCDPLSLRLRGHCTPNLKLACFVGYPKINNTFFRKIIHVSYSKLSEELKSGTENLVGQAVF